MTATAVMGLPSFDAAAAIVLAGVVTTVLKTVVAVLGGLTILWLGVLALRVLSQPQPEPPPRGELRKVRLTYRCSMCGAEVRMTTAPQEDPEPPRHCGDEMSLLAPIED